MTPEDMSLREINKEKRRTAILTAAKDLFREHGGMLASAERIAKRAGVSTATLYNLVGKREELLGALFNEIGMEFKERMDAIHEPDPILRTAAAIELSIQIRVRDPEVSRVIFGELSQQGADRIRERMNPQPIELQYIAMRSAKAHGQLIPDADPLTLSRQIWNSHNGAFQNWMGGLTDSNTVLRQSLHGFWTVIAAYGNDEERARAYRQLENLTEPANNTDQAETPWTGRWFAPRRPCNPLPARSPGNPSVPRETKGL